MQSDADKNSACAWQLRRAQPLLIAAGRARAGTIVIFDRFHLASAPRHLVREAFRLIWEREGWPLDAMGFDAWERLAGVTLTESAALDLPGGIRARCVGRVVQIGRPL